MTKNEKLNFLFDKQWRQRYQPNDFAEDGIIDEKSWNIAKRKILFLLKETNKYPADMRELIRQGPWQVLGYWSFGLLHTTIDRIPLFYETQQDSNWKDANKNTAILNLKKSPGDSSTVFSSLREIALRDKDLILEEISIIEPQVIVCGSTFDLCKEILLKGDLAPISTDGHCYLLMNTLWIKFWHPSWYSLPHILGYYGLMKIFQNALTDPRVAKMLL